MITQGQKKEIQQAHAAFIAMGDNTYLTHKEVFGHISRGSYISNQMLNCYLTLVPSAARVKVVECDLDDMGESDESSRAKEDS